MYEPPPAHPPPATTEMNGPATAPGFGFERAVGPGGYAWWYVDALSDDGTEALTLIGFIGSVFSPYYAWSGRREPEAHCALNVALYRARDGRWAMTERGRFDLARTPNSLQIGPSSMVMKDDALVVDIDEVGWPLPRRVRGQVRVTPELRGGPPVVLLESGQHCWWPIAPRARVEVAFEQPSVRWSGTGYFDSNWGAAPLEDDFQSWTWSRAPLARGAAVLYEMTPRVGPSRSMALRFEAGRERQTFEPPPRVSLAPSLFGIERSTRSEGDARLVKTLTDAHFYARSVIETELCGERVIGVHERLELDRFRAPWAKWILPFRMPRRASARPRLTP